MTMQPNLRSVPMVSVEQVPEQGEDETRATQAALEGVSQNTGDGDEQEAHTPTPTVECLGGRYRVADKVGLMPLMRFAHAANQGIDTADMEGLAAIYDMLADCLHPEDWPRFVNDMTVQKADAEDMLPVVQQTIEALTAHPTERRSDSSDGSPATSPTSTDGSSSAGSAPPPRPDREGLTPVADLVASQR